MRLLWISLVALTRRLAVSVVVRALIEDQKPSQIAYQNSVVIDSSLQVMVTAWMTLLDARWSRVCRKRANTGAMHTLDICENSRQTITLACAPHPSAAPTISTYEIHSQQMCAALIREGRERGTERLKRRQGHTRVRSNAVRQSVCKQKPTSKQFALVRTHDMTRRPSQERMLPDSAFTFQPPRARSSLACNHLSVYVGGVTPCTL